MPTRLEDSWRNYLLNRYPICAQANESTIYQAFFQRRAEHKQTIRERLTNPGRGFDGHRFLIPFLLIIVFVASTYFLSCCGIMLAGWANRKIIAQSARNRLSGNSMPSRVAGVFSEGGCAHLAATDLWLTGIKGRDVLLAILREKVEFNSYLTAIGLTVYLVLMCAALPDGGMLLLFSDPLLVFSLILAIVLYLPAFIDWVFIHAVEFHLDWRLNVWSPSYRWPGSGMFKRWNLLLYILFTSFLPLFFVMMGFFMYEFLEELPVFYGLPWLSTIRWGLLALFAVLISFPLMRVIGKIARDSTTDKLDVMLLDADLAFEYYMYSVVIGDHDSAVRLMDWRNMEPIRRMPDPSHTPSQDNTS